VRRDVKKNGFACPFHPLQILSYFVILLDLYCFYFINIVAISHNVVAAVILGVIYGVIFFFIVVLAIKATKSDPTDPTIYAEREAEAKGVEFDNSPYKFFCEACSTHVQDNAKHCGACNRCVEKFDHHCRWLNNCVGKANYTTFFKLICVVLLMCLYHIAFNVFVIVQLYKDGSEVQSSTGDFYDTETFILHFVFNFAAIFFNVLATAFLGHLISFHIFLQRKNLTTFEYIQIKENRQNRKSRLFREVHKEEGEKELNGPGDDADTENVGGVQNKPLKDNESLIKVEGNVDLEQQKTVELSGSKDKSKRFNKRFLCFSKKDTDRVETNSYLQQQNLDSAHAQENQVDFNEANG